MRGIISMALAITLATVPAAVASQQNASPALQASGFRQMSGESPGVVHRAASNDKTHDGQHGSDLLCEFGDEDAPSGDESGSTMPS